MGLHAHREKGKKAGKQRDVKVENKKSCILICSAGSRYVVNVCWEELGMKEGLEGL